MRAVAQKLRDSRLTAAAGTIKVAGDRIDTPPFSDGQEATEVWVGKEVVFITELNEENCPIPQQNFVSFKSPKNAPWTR